jgi:hypothetical protein
MNEIFFSIVVGIIIGLVLFYILSKWWGRRGGMQSQVTRFPEKDAENLLRRAGFQILDKNRKEAVITVINGKDHYGNLEADYIVKKQGKKFVIVVHSGEGSPDANEPNYRRRLLEYDRVFSTSGILILDLNKGQIHRVNFRFPHERNIDFFFRFLVALFIIFGVIGIIWMLTALRLF